MRHELCAQYLSMGLTELLPGVFVDFANHTGLHIVDEEGEAVCWVDTEWEDPAAVTAALSAVVIAAKYGAGAVRQNLEEHGELLAMLVEETKQLAENPEFYSVWIILGEHPDFHDEESIYQYTFGTHAELEAFLYGMDEADGWLATHQFDTHEAALEFLAAEAREYQSAEDTSDAG
jgi:hypothetical protein